MTDRRLQRLLTTVVTAVVTLCAVATAAQTVPSGYAGSFWPAMTAAEKVVTPSPEADKLPAAPATDVDHATGTVMLSVPLLSWQAGDIGMNLSLAGRARAFRTSEEAGWVGLGWSLEGLGSVSRSIVGMPDESVPFDLRAPSAADAAYIEALTDDRIDASCDRYSYSCPEGSGQFIILNGKIVQLPKTANIIELIGDTREGVRDFRITAPSGVSYEFREREHIEFQSLPAVVNIGESYTSYRAVSTWHLSRIVSPEGADSIAIYYESMPRWTRDNASPSYTHTSRYDNGSIQNCGWVPQRGTDVSGTGRSVFPDTRIPLEIKSRTASVKFLSEQVSYGRKFLTGMILSDHKGNVVTRVEISGTGGAAGGPRRHMTAVTISDAANNLRDKVTFSYWPENHNSTGDLFGYPNAMQNASGGIRSVLNPETALLNERRRPVVSYIRSGCLHEFTTAAGLVTTLEYEAARVPLPEGWLRECVAPDTTIIIGCRVKRVISLDKVTGARRERIFSYSDAATDIPLESYGQSDFVTLSALESFYSLSTSALAKVVSTSATLIDGSRRPGASLTSAQVYYGRVTETVSGTGLDDPLHTDYEFDLSRCRKALLPGGKMMPAAGAIGAGSTLAPAYLPANTSDARRKLFLPSSVTSYLREHIGAAPELKRLTVFRNKAGTRIPDHTEEYFYLTADSTCVATGFFHEPFVHRTQRYTGKVVKNFNSEADFSCFRIMTEASCRAVDSVRVTQYFTDGASRTRTEKRHYAGLRIRVSGTVRPQIGYIGGIGALTKTPWNTDSITTGTSYVYPIGTTIREGGHVMEHFTACADMVSKGFFQEASRRGLRSLPVREMWVMDRCDTLMRVYGYGMFPVSGKMKILPVSTSTFVHRASGRILTDLQRIPAYIGYALPQAVLQTGKPQTLYEWDLASELPTAIIQKSYDGNLSLRTTLRYTPLVGCTGITRPSGRKSAFTYRAGRLYSETNTLGGLIRQYEYNLWSQTSLNSITTSVFGNAGNNDAASISVVYNGFGEEVASVNRGFGSDGGDVATLTNYDALGRAMARWYPWSSMNDELLRNVLKGNASPVSLASQTYGDGEAVMRMSYPGEYSGLALTKTLGGSDFAEHPMRNAAVCSSDTDAERKVVRWSWDGATLKSAGYYSAGELDGVRTEDGDGRRCYVFTDCLGRHVLSRAIGDGGVFVDTYTVSDAWGNPLVVIPPELSARLASGKQCTADLLDSYAFVYSYDSRLRLRSRKLPGASAVNYAYDSESRVCFSRDGNRYASGRCLFTLYDPLGRPAVTGTCADPLTEAGWSGTEADVPVMTAVLTAKADGTSGLCGTGYTAMGQASSLLSDARLLTAAYYDSYDFIPEGTNLIRSAAAKAPLLTIRPDGLVTGSLTAVQGHAEIASGVAPLLSINYYDVDDNLVETRSQTHLGAVRTLCTDYTLSGLPTTVTESLVTPAGKNHSVSTYTSYDTFGRVLAATASYGGGAPKILKSNTFDNLGRLAQTQSAGNLSRTVSYDCHGWLTDWTAAGITQSLKFAVGPQPSYSGKISLKQTTRGSSGSKYAYEYDRLGRLIGAKNTLLGVVSDVGSDSTNTEDSGKNFSSSYTYDLHGNLLALKRWGLVNMYRFGKVDDITACYDGNRLKSMTEAAADVLLESTLDIPRGAWSGDDFAYDANGNQTRDMSRGVTDVTYNALNLPERVTTSDGTIDYLYDGFGTKLAEILTSSRGIVMRRDYIGSFELGDSILSRTYIPGGYFATDSVLHLYISDYQGNNLAIYNTKTSKAGSITDSYPYGLPHDFVALELGKDPGRNPDIIIPGIIKPQDPVISDRPIISHLYTPPHDRLYSGKELSTSRGQNLYDFHARWLNPAFPGFTTQDSYAEAYTNLSPYVYCAADPINNIDTDGRVVETLWDVGMMTVDIGLYIYHEFTGNKEAAKSDIADLVMDTGAALIPGVPAGISKAAKLCKTAAQTVEKKTVEAAGKKATTKATTKATKNSTKTTAATGNKSKLKNAERIKEGKAYEIELAQKYEADGVEFCTNIRIVPLNDIGNVKLNRTHSDFLIRLEKDEYKVTESKLTEQGCSLSPGQQAAQTHVLTGNGYFEIRTKKSPFGLENGAIIHVKEYEVSYKYPNLKK